jgi:hypothetical protein
MKRYTLYYFSDLADNLSNLDPKRLREYGKANSVKTIKGYVARVKRERAEENPHDFFYTDSTLQWPLAMENRIYL